MNAEPRTTNWSERHSRRWGVILAGGDGRRLLPLTRAICGDDRPKQFCDIIGGGTLLNQTRRRISGMIGAQETLLVMTRTHQRFYSNQVAGAFPSCVVIQPYNKGTAPAILYSLMRVQDMDPAGLVAIFPSDHHIANNAALAAEVDLAFSVAESRPDLVTLLGIVPDSPEVAYGWIEPGSPLGNCPAGSLFHVSRFWEKPSRPLASDLMRHGCLWNSFIMVGRVCAFFKLIRQAAPELLDSFETMRPLLRTPAADKALDDLYSSIPAVSFSDSVLAVRPFYLAVLRASGLGWSDLGEPGRVTSILRRKGVNTEWDSHPDRRATGTAGAPAG